MHKTQARTQKVRFCARAMLRLHVWSHPESCKIHSIQCDRYTNGKWIEKRRKLRRKLALLRDRQREREGRSGSAEESEVSLWMNEWMKYVVLVSVWTCSHLRLKFDSILMLAAPMTRSIFTFCFFFLLSSSGSICWSHCYTNMKSMCMHGARVIVVGEGGGGGALSSRIWYLVFVAWNFLRKNDVYAHTHRPTYTIHMYLFNVRCAYNGTKIYNLRRTRSFLRKTRKKKTRVWNVGIWNMKCGVSTLHRSISVSTLYCLRTGLDRQNEFDVTAIESLNPHK